MAVIFAVHGLEIELRGKVGEGGEGTVEAEVDNAIRVRLGN